MGMVDAVPPTSGAGDDVKIIGDTSAPKPGAELALPGRDDKPSEWAPIVLKLLQLIEQRPELLGMILPGMAVPSSPAPQTFASHVDERRRVEVYEGMVGMAPAEMVRDKAEKWLAQVLAWVKAAPAKDVKATARVVLSELTDRDVDTFERVKAKFTGGGDE